LLNLLDRKTIEFKATGIELQIILFALLEVNSLRKGMIAFFREFHLTEMFCANMNIFLNAEGSAEELTSEHLKRFRRILCAFSALNSCKYYHVVSSIYCAFSAAAVGEYGYLIKLGSLGLLWELWVPKNGKFKMKNGRLY
jgi:hypothetical protein